MLVLALKFSRGAFVNEDDKRGRQKAPLENGTENSIHPVINWELPDGCRDSRSLERR
jgi:hypothetical protein